MPSSGLGTVTLLLNLLAVVAWSTPATAQPPEAMLRALSVEEFSVREQAQADLLKWAQKKPQAAVKALVSILEESTDPEIQARLLAVLQELSEEDYLSSGKGFLGISMGVAILMAEGEKARTVVRITEVHPGTPAEAAGLLPEDGILSVDGKVWKEIDPVNALTDYIASRKPRDVVQFEIMRQGNQRLRVTVTLGRRPVDDLSMVQGNLAELDRQARLKHFRAWLEAQMNHKRPK